MSEMLPGGGLQAERARPVFGLEAAAIVRFHDRFLAGEAPEPLPGSPAVREWIKANHASNAELWREEDKARRTDVADREIVRCKRSIDALNQRRNDAVEALDDAILAELNQLGVEPSGRLSSETAGAMVDRLSILSLKIHHMRLQTQRPDAPAGHVERCADKLATLIRQRHDLAACLDRLLDEARCGAAYFRTYRQFKMYNDPALNPELYAGRRCVRDDLPAARVDVLIPTCDRPAGLAVTLTSLFGQSFADFRVVISDQGEISPADESAEVRAIVRLLVARGVEVEMHRHLPRRGLAEQRDFLLQHAHAPYVLFLDDDVVIEPDLVGRLVDAIRAQRCGFVGSALIGMSYVDDERPEQQHIEFWDGPVEPEEVAPGTPAWERHHLHSAANLYHVQQRLGLRAHAQRVYRVAWVGGCVLFDAAKLREAGGFGFWTELPPEHAGEDVVAQMRVMARYGGCGVIPSGAYHQELPTTVPCRDVDAPHVLGSRAAAT